MTRLHAGGIHRKWLLTTRRFRAARDLLTATDRMRDDWAEGDDARKQELWRAVHNRADEFREVMQ
jgi:hypothetical protein